VADTSNQLVLSALSRAAAHADGLPLQGGKSASGLFPSNAAGKQAAQLCLQEGYLRSLSPTREPAAGGSDGATTTAVKKSKTKAAPETYTISERGLAYLFQQVSPRQVLEDMVRVLEARQQQIDQLSANVGQMQASLQALRKNAEQVLQEVRQPAPFEKDSSPGSLSMLFRAFFQQAGQTPPQQAPQQQGPTSPAGFERNILTALTRWQDSGASEDYPLPELFRQLGQQTPALTIGQFHDLLRRLHDAGQIALHPWTGPLYDLPEPAHALMNGHTVAYYASLRQGAAQPAEPPSPGRNGVV
jgi:hypothetical protein